MEDDELLVDYQSDPVISDHGYAGRMYKNHGSKEFVEISNHAMTLVDSAIAVRARLAAHDLLRILAEGGFAEAIDQPRFSGVVLAEMKVADFVVALLSLSPHAQDRAIMTGVIS